jgi:LDH2 family malate/lactate/ureidoglycolate dehydrogenase
MAQRGERLPQGWAVDINGNPTTDPLEALRGLVLPIGGHKGYGLALAMDILSGVLTGSGFSTGVKSLFQQWQEPQHVGHFFIVIDPARFMSLEKFQRRMSRMRRRIKRARPIDDGNPVFLPGEIEARLEEERRISGIPMRESTLERLKRLAEGRDSERPPAF